MPVPFERMNTGTIIIHDPKYENQPAAPTANGRTVCYARVSSSDQKDDLQRQADRLKAFAINMGVKSPEVVTETGSGMNDKRRKLLWVTAEGEEAVLRMKPGVARVQQRLLAPLSEPDQAQFVNLLAQLVAAHEQARSSQHAA